MKYEMTKENYLLLKEFIEINDLEIEIVSVVMDEPLYNLGFVKSIPCIVELNATEKAIEKASEITIWYEINAFNTPNTLGPAETDEDYIIYRKYGWIWDLFNTEGCCEYKEPLP